MTRAHPSEPRSRRHVRSEREAILSRIREMTEQSTQYERWLTDNRDRIVKVLADTPSAQVAGTVLPFGELITEATSITATARDLVESACGKDGKEVAEQLTRTMAATFPGAARPHQPTLDTINAPR